MYPTYPEVYVEYQEACRAVSRNGMALAHVTTSIADYKLCMRAVIQNGLAIQFAPLAQIDEAMCLAAVHRSQAAIHHLPCHLLITKVQTEHQRRWGLIERSIAVAICSI